MNLDDPKLTAFAMDELDESDKSVIAKEIAASPEAQHEVDEIRGVASALRNEFAAELEGRATASPASQTMRAVLRNSDAGAGSALHDQRSLSDIRGDRWFWQIARPLSIAAVLAIAAIIAVVAIGTQRKRGEVAILQQGEMTVLPVEPKLDQALMEAPGEAEVEAPTSLAQAGASNTPGIVANPPVSAFELSKIPASKQKQRNIDELSRAVGGEFREELNIRRNPQQFSTAAYDHIEENPFLDAKSNPLSTFSIDVDTASYSNVRRFINEGGLPPKDAVRVEELINYFNYDYPQPNDGKPFSVQADVAGCPWEASHRLVRIGLKGKEIAADKRGASNLVFLLDVSGSMMPPERLPLVKQAMRLLTEKLTENDRVAIVVYAGSSGMVLPSTTGDHKEQILDALENLQAGGSTNGAEGIQLAYSVAQKNFIKGGVNRVILATDGDFNVGVTSQGDLIRLIQEKARDGVFLSVLGVGTDNLKDSTMQKLADKGNGNYAYLDSLDEARKVLVQQVNGTLVTIARDVKIQVEFNPARVQSYRLIGYEKRVLRKEDFNNDKVDAGEIGAGHTVTALYEVVPVGATTDPAASIPPVDRLKYGTNEPGTANGSAARDGGSYNGESHSSEMMTVKLRYKKPDGDKSELLERVVTDSNAGFAKASPDFKFAAAAAEFGMLLRDSEHKGKASLGSVLEWAQEGKGADPNGYRQGFIDLVRKAQTLSKG
jgi:Ca-activated chloride channel family protein